MQIECGCIFERLGIFIESQLSHSVLTHRRINFCICHYQISLICFRIRFRMWDFWGPEISSIGKETQLPEYPTI